MEPKNGVLEDDFPFQTGDFQVPAVNFPGCTSLLGSPPGKGSQQNSDLFGITNLCGRDETNGFHQGTWHAAK